MADVADEVENLKAQTGLAVVALGIAFAQTLHAHDTPPRVLESLRTRTQEAYDHLQAGGALDAAAMVGQFVRALNDPGFFPVELSKS
jgi:hypothetical protein